MTKRFLLIDANSLIHRAFHALPPLTTPAGDPIGAVYGFTSMLIKAVRELQPDYAAACFDLPGPTFRHEAFMPYKAQRPKMPEELAGQLEKTKEVLAAFGITALASPGFEADDVIGALSELAGHENVETVILTGDLDTLQLASENVKICAMKKGVSDMTLYDEAGVEERYGFKPALLSDYKALRGDPSDNIPGVRGIGEKTAAELVRRLGTLEKIYEALEKPEEFDRLFGAAVRRKLAEGREGAFLSKSLASIRRNAPIRAKLGDLKFSGIPQDKIIPLFRNLGFKSLMERIKNDAAGHPA